MVRVRVARRVRHTPGGRELYPHQCAALDKVKGCKNAPLYMQMRLGKSPTLITWIVGELGRPPRALLVTPRSTIPGWGEQLDLEKQPWAVARGDKATREHVARVAKGWVLTNYESLRVSPEMLKLPWDLVALDESTRIRNAKAQVTELLCKNTRAPYRAVLSGLPNPEGPMDYFCQMYFLRREFMGVGGSFPDAFYRWRHRFFKSDFMGYDWVPKDGTEERIKDSIHRIAVVQTREQVGLGGSKVYEKRTVKMNKAQREMNEQLLAEFSCKMRDGTTKETKWATTKLQWMGRVAGGFDPDGGLVSDNKIKELLELLQGDLAKEQVLVWFNFNAEMDEASKAIFQAGIPCAVVEGSTKDEDRKVYIDLFQKGTIRVLCLQVRCGQYGLTLPQADTAVYYSNAYDGELRSQSEDRVVHMAKDTPSLFIDLVSEGSIDEHVLTLLNKKRVGAKYFMSELTKEVLR